jgi:hypothetical protein
MRIRSKLFYRIEAVAFLLYWKTFYFSVEPVAWRLYRRLVRGLCLLLKPFDTPEKLPVRAVLFDVNYAKQQQLFARPNALQNIRGIR